MPSISPIDTPKALSQALIQEKKKTLLGRHVVWLQKERHGMKKVLFKIIMIGEAALATISIVGLVAVAKGYQCYKSVKNYKQLEVKLNPERLPPKEKIELKSKTAAFNHMNDYVLHEGAIWVRPRNQVDAPWEMIYFDALNSNIQPVEIKADGANLIVLDNERNIHYKKVLKEKLDNKDRYSCTDISKKDNWNTAWFSFPIIRTIYRLFATARLKISDDMKSWAISHRGKFNRYFEDVSGKEHPEFAMVTTLYALPKKGDRILYADPYLLRSFKYEISLPEGVQGEAIDASASTIFLKAIRNGKTEFYTRLADFDTLGGNPFLPGFYSKKSRGSEQWTRQPDVQLEGKAELSGSITILQAGPGNSARILRISGTNAEGKAGYYQKLIDESSWNFQALDT